MSRLAIFALLAMVQIARGDDSVRLHAEVDPLPFVRSGYGGQVGARHDGVVRGLRVAAASFALDVPDFAAELGGNDGFHIRVRPSGALYVLYYRGNVALGGSVRYLRLRYTHDDAGDARADTSELSPEAIVGYKWQPTRHGFYLQPWFGLAATVWRSRDARVGDRTYDPLPVQAFFTVNLGWELVL